jgi:LacI family kdg operon repressor
VSKATVSRFLNHRETLLTPDIAVGSNARGGAGLSAQPHGPGTAALRSRLIGLVVADVTNPSVRAARRRAGSLEAGYLMLPEPRQ